MKNIIKNQRLFFISLIGIVVVSLTMTATYAYQTIQIDKTEGSDTEIKINVGKLDVSFTLNCKEGEICDANNDNYNRINITNIPLLPDYKTADYTEFTIDNNNSSADVLYQLKLTELEFSESLVTDDFKYTITKEIENKEISIAEGDFSNLSGDSIILPFSLSSYRNIKKGEQETLKLYLWIKETKNEQAFEQTSFKGKIEILSMFASEIEETIYTNLKIHGNSIQDGTPSIDTPVEIQNLGTLIFDTTSENYGKYEIPITLAGKNLFNNNAEPIRATYLSAISYNNGIKVTSTAIASTSSLNIYYHLGDYSKYVGKTLSVTLENVSNTENKSFTGYLIKNTGDYSSNTSIKAATWQLGEKKTITTMITADDSAVNLGLRFYLGSGVDKEFIIDNIQVEISDIATEYEPYIEPITRNMYLDEPLRKVNDDTDYIDFNNNIVVRNIKVLDDTGTLLLNESYKKLEVPNYEKLNQYNIPYIENANITACSSNGVCASKIEIETNK